MTFRDHYSFAERLMGALIIGSSIITVGWLLDGLQLAAKLGGGV